MEKETKLIGEVDQAQIDKWKADPKNKGVNAIVVGGHICYLRKADRNVMSYALTQMSFNTSQGSDSEDGKVEISMGRLYKTGEALMNNCWLGGSEEIRTDDTLWLNACIKAGEVIEFKETQLKNF